MTFQLLFIRGCFMRTGPEKLHPSPKVDITKHKKAWTLFVMPGLWFRASSLSCSHGIQNEELSFPWGKMKFNTNPTPNTPTPSWDISTCVTVHSNVKWRMCHLYAFILLHMAMCQQLPRINPISQELTLSTQISNSPLTWDQFIRCVMMQLLLAVWCLGLF